MRINRALPLAGACAALAAATAPVHASVLYADWNYAIDSQTDGSPAAGGIYEYRGLAFRNLGGRAYFAISSHMPQAGNHVAGARNGAVNHGDLFLNFSGHNLNAPAKFTDPQVYAIRFDASNDSLGSIAGSNTLNGVFGNVSVSSLTTLNSGWPTLSAYSAGGWGRTAAAMGDLNDNVNAGGDAIAYLGSGTQYPNMLAGTRLDGIALLNRSQLSRIGLNFAHFAADPAGNNVWGFSLDESLLPAGGFTGHLYEECINDGVAIRAANVPEPGALAACAAGAAAAFIALRRRRRAR